MADKKAKKARPAAPKQTAKKVVKKAAPATAKPAAKAAAKAKTKTIFFTGFPGFIGKRLVHKLLEENAQTRFVMLVQEKFFDAAQRSVDDLAQTMPTAKTNIELLPGDLTVDGFGFDAATTNRLRRDVTEVWHLAAVYDLAVPEKIAWNINVEGTRRVLDFCEGLKNFDKLVYVSTCYVAGKRTGLVVEVFCFETDPVWTEPEALRAALGSYETIGRALAKDCREGTDTTWEHRLLRHNSGEIGRLRERVRPILFT